MLPKLNLMPRKAPYIVTASSPSKLSKESVGLDSKTLLVFQDLDGAADATPCEYEIDETVAKLVIHDVSNLKIAVKKGIVTTVEIHNARNLDIHLDSIPQSASASHTPGPSIPGVSPSGTAAEKTNYGTLSLDPSLDTVRVTYARPELVGAIVFASPSSSIPDRKATNVSLAIEGGEVLPLADAQGLVEGLIGGTVGEGEQYHIYHTQGEWQIKGLERREKDYPALS